ncbi:DJ-1/PfpI/YhbO family deglycase/protease [Streptomyces spirodelae]|uniref:DJ-1/PfpI/YhbO family deglycase/protease n=1 Tax=Streptomyces spirodelae TaxID=2812904 RepID=A0ABS3WPC4_9ACTN|nr:DJ-1/PfpI/YhbO family deglycase/protease [Streptomyces spirodelae]MBO8184968.1 DJ-1/PfpI/YhbO family deglycase/protease [Streptomyces spirodelae]
MTAVLHGTRVALLATDGVERVELEQPRGALHGAGAQTELISLHTGEINARQMDIDPAGTLTVDRTVADASADDYDALVLPGGAMNPDQLRTDPDAVGFAREFMRADKPVAAICHGPVTLAEAEVVRGRRLTSWPSIRTDLRNAGAEVVEEEVVIDRNLLTSRGFPDDFAPFCAALVAHVARATNRAPQPA